MFHWSCRFKLFRKIALKNVLLASRLKFEAFIVKGAVVFPRNLVDTSLPIVPKSKAVVVIWVLKLAKVIFLYLFETIPVSSKNKTKSASLILVSVSYWNNVCSKSVFNFE